MRKIKNIFSAFIVMVFIFITCFTTSCDDYKSEEFEISALDSKACQQLKIADSLVVDSVAAVLLSSFDSTWVDSLLYDEATETYNNVSEIIDSLVANDIIVTNTSTSKIYLKTLAATDTNYFALQTSSASLTFFSNKSVSVNLIDQEGIITGVFNNKIPLETVAGCQYRKRKRKESVTDSIDWFLIQTRVEISVPDNVSLLQLIKNEQTDVDAKESWHPYKPNEIYVAIL